MNFPKIILLSFLVLLSGCSAVAQYEYVNQEPPKLEPQVFAPGVISLANEYEFGSVFNQDGTEFFYGVTINGKAQIRYSKRVGQTWTVPKVILDHPVYGYNDPFLSPDEKRLYFISKRAIDGNGPPKDHDIWYVERTSSTWSEPINAGVNINSSGNEYYISFTNDGSMYFATNGLGDNHDIYKSPFVNGTFQKAIKLPKTINTGAYEADVFVAPDESYLIFCTTRRSGQGRGDLYISFKNNDGNWSQAKNMGDAINTKSHELCPFVTADGKYFFYTSNKDIYWVSTAIFEGLRNKE